MVIIRGTRKFLDRVGPASEPQTASTTMLGDWFATVLFWKPQLALFVNLFVNATTLLPVFVPLAPATSVLDRFPGALAVVLRAHGVAQGIIDRELGEIAELPQFEYGSYVEVRGIEPRSRCLVLGSATSVGSGRLSGCQAPEPSGLTTVRH